MIIKNILIGLFYGLFASMICSFMITIAANVLAGGTGNANGWWWFFLTLSIPLSLSMAVSGCFLHRINFWRIGFWLMCAGIGYLNLLIMGTAGAIVVSVQSRGYQSVNIEGYLQWGPIYALIFLPVSMLIVAGLQLGLRKILKISSPVL